MSSTRSRLSRATQGRGALLTLALLFLLSGAIRAFDGMATASVSELGSGETNQSEPTAAIDDAGLVAAMEALRARATRITETENALADRIRALEVAEATIARQLEQLAAAEQRLEATMARSETAAEDDLAKLTSVYENMKPKEASKVFARMAPEFAAGFLGRMRADAAARILAGLEPEKAYSISVLLAGRNAHAPVD